MYIDCDLRYTIIEKSSNEAFQALWIEIHFTNKANIICGVIYRQHNSPEQFQEYFEETVQKSLGPKPRGGGSRTDHVNSSKKHM